MSDLDNTAPPQSGRSINISQATITISAMCAIILAILGGMVWVMDYSDRTTKKALDAHDDQPYHGGIIPYVDGQLSIQRDNMAVQFEALNLRLSSIEKNVDRNGDTLKEIYGRLNDMAQRRASLSTRSIDGSGP